MSIDQIQALSFIAIVTGFCTVMCPTLCFLLCTRPKIRRAYF